ncbi:uncharacterized protein BO66DRAFT_217414 [Aspergillus aculeatinus CBS 121060]|uniref:Uncharacterized protein n=1 Tax=Aspergillus aculeatinus CBS 121060 TaxID=1448322 RepID=A0ACD1GUF2_9EURO|nr:hypothetical protein BO66DRAFT_217414 [Aspergillus aculeatinus CBS 121060]RAH65084.1 hypothetical protein BO66DRAFT_217414 [Aspergillus aculeatinus CBS 121060]
MVIYRYGHGPRDKRFRLKSSLVFRILRHYDRDQELICQVPPGALPTVPVVCLCLCLPGTKKGGWKTSIIINTNFKRLLCWNARH